MTPMYTGKKVNGWRNQVTETIYDKERRCM
jgi:hypothetical protein